MNFPDNSNTLTAPYWEAAAEGRWVMCWCRACDVPVWYPKTHCPDCHGNTLWRELCGKAVLVSWTVVEMPVNPGFVTPYLPALVVPVEAASRGRNSRVVTQLTDCEGVELRCDMPVKLRFKQLEMRDGNSVKRFRAPLFAPSWHGFTPQAGMPA